MQLLSLAEKKQKWKKIRESLMKTYVNRKTELDYESAWELLVAVILSAQCTDDRVNLVTKDLFARYKTIGEYADCDISELEKIIYSTGFYRSKAKYIQSSAGKIRQDFAGIVPDSMDILVTLPGVARKTANVVLQNIYDKMDGIAVDTHIIRFANRFGFSDSKNSDNIEQDLMQIIDRSEWMIAGYWIKEYGRGPGKADGSGYRIQEDPFADLRIDI
jgi:endonuclease III